MLREPRSLSLSSYFIMCCSPQPALWPWLNSSEDTHVIFVSRGQTEHSTPAYDSQEGITFPSACCLCFGWYSLGNSSLAGTGVHWGLLSHLMSTRTPTYILCCKAPCQHSITPQPALVHEFAPSQIQDLTFLFVELSEVPLGLFPQLVKSPWIAVKPPAHSALPSFGIIHGGACQAVTRAVVKVFDTIHPSNTAEHWPPARLQLFTTHLQAQTDFQPPCIPHLPSLATAPLLPVDISAVLWLRKHCKNSSAEIRGRRAGLFPSLCCVTFSKWPKPQRPDATCCLNKAAYATDCRCSCIWGKTLFVRQLN